jgi:hypothetical protein
MPASPKVRRHHLNVGGSPPQQAISTLSSYARTLSRSTHPTLRYLLTNRLYSHAEGGTWLQHEFRSLNNVPPSTARADATELACNKSKLRFQVDCSPLHCNAYVIAELPLVRPQPRLASWQSLSRGL